MTVRVEFVSKRFSGQHGAPAVNSVSFEAQPGGITTLLGPSGSGKSTLLRLIAGLEVPDAGRVLINGLDSTRISPRQRNVGFVFQNYALFKHMTVFDNIAFGMRVRKREGAEVRGRVRELLELVQLAEYGERFPSQLSGGQRQRVALARALATNPHVLLLDEPFGALDAKVRVELREWLHQFQERAGITTLLVTHDQEEALELSSHIVLLNEGAVEQAGAPHELYDSPATQFVASFLGGGSVFRGTVRSGRASVGPLELSVAESVPDGASVQALVRPHNVKLAKTDVERGVSVAHVERLRRIGPQVKLLLSLAKLNLAIRGIDANIVHGDTFHADGHKDLKADGPGKKVGGASLTPPLRSRQLTDPSRASTQGPSPETNAPGTTRSLPHHESMYAPSLRAHIKQRRLTRAVATTAGGTLGDYVPFNFCPRSVMLFAVHKGHQDLRGRSGERRAPDQHGQSSDRPRTRVGVYGSPCRTRARPALRRPRQAVRGALARHGRAVLEWVKEERQAEFLVREFFPWTAVGEVAVMTAAAAQRVQTALAGAQHRPVVTIHREWYY